MKKIIIIGGKGNGTLILTAIEEINAIKKEWEILGFLNDRETSPISGYPILGKIDRETVHQYLTDENLYFYYALISIKFNDELLFKLQSLDIPMDRFATIIHPSASVPGDVNVGHGCCILQGVCIARLCKIGNFVQILPQAFLGIETVAEDFSYVAAKAYVGAYGYLEWGSYMGAASALIEFKRVGRRAIVGMGAVVIEDVPPHVKFAGNPARQIGINE